MHIGSDEHKELFCRSFIETHRAYDPKDWPWPQLDEMSIARLRAIPIWAMALEIETSAGAMLEGYAKTEPDPLVSQALALQGYEEDRHGRILACMIERYGLNVHPEIGVKEPTRQAFVNFGYDECVDSFAGFGIFRLARDARILPEALTSLFTRVLVEEARHIVFFVNWIAWDRTRSGLRGQAMQAIPALVSYGQSIVRRAKGGAALEGPGESATLALFGEVLNGLTPASFIRACVTENERYMSDFDPRLLRPRVIPALGKIALGLLEVADWVRETLRETAPRPTGSG